MEAKEQYKLFLKLAMKSFKLDHNIEGTCYYQKAMDIHGKTKIMDKQLYQLRLTIDRNILQTLN